MDARENGWEIERDRRGWEIERERKEKLKENRRRENRKTCGKGKSGQRRGWKGER